MSVLIKNNQRLLKINTKKIKDITGDLLDFSGLEGRDLSILFTDNKRIWSMNKEFFDRDRATNVISFSYMEDPMPGEAVGDIIISVERAAEEAKSAGLQFYERLLALIVHGLVHILGYDHEAGAKENRRMKYRERKFMAFVKFHSAYEGLVREIV